MNNNLKKIIYKKRKERSKKKLIKFPIFFTSFVFIGYLFFFTSNFWLNNQTHIDNSYMLGDILTANERNVAITSLEYSKKDKNLEAIIEIENVSLDKFNKYTWFILYKNEFVKPNLILERSNFVVLELEDISSKDAMILKMKQKDTGFKNIIFRVDPKYIKSVDSIEKLNEDGYIKKSIKSKISIYSKNISSIKKEINEKKEVSNLASKKISRLEKSLNNKTGEERDITITNINQLKSKMNLVNDEILDLETEISNLREKIKLQKGLLEKWEMKN